LPVCIYCLHTKADDEFEPEHVLPRGFAGAGVNWTLTGEVCRQCNRHFSTFEAHWLRQAMESMARNFQGPVSRNERERFDRAQPVEIDDLYILLKGDPLVYEAGFAFPNDPHFRPQIIDTGKGVSCVVGRMDDVPSLKAGLDAMLLAERFDVTVPRWREGHSDWLIASVLRRQHSPHFVIEQWRRESKPSGLWLRGFPHDSFLAQREHSNAHMTARLAIDHRRRLYVRAANIEAAVSFFDLLLQPHAPIEKCPDIKPGDQTVAFSFQINLNHVYKAVLKTGFNLYCYLYGVEYARHSNFQLLREILLRDKKDNSGASLALRACRMEAGDTPDFPKSANTDEHRMQLDLAEDGILRFRLRLYDSFGYYAHLGVVPAEMRSAISTRRVSVRSATDGIREVDHW